MKQFNPTLYLVTDSLLAKGKPLENVVEQAVNGGVTLVQLREKNCPVSEFIQKAIRLKSILSKYNIPLIINDRLDVALASEADGLHIGRHDIPYVYARKALGHDKIIGLSVESIEQAEEANNFDVDYIGISPVFATPTKTDTAPPIGIEGVKSIASFSKHIMVGIGGINAQNALDVLKAGADGVAVVSAIMAADDPFHAAREIFQVISNFKDHKK